ncbi:CMGC/SRPK protein kinase [Blastomyces gilchristii SLH14081]|uniref:EKC/KEOPS complex subunit BUD32 n=1 Tax=Blastomyces gilchristii (strain SLH14081) TaxID=559298 RepID=A0A179UA12_BLAGS|nr:CMGC/SRPK protein kinase [Blastomyces gilchristii SLH14081]OAT04835.1 CMGC/SRPK protein kinase [Blastomyces gilchristii SLH14081]
MIAPSSHSIRFQLVHTQQLLNASPRIFPKLFQIFITRNMSTAQLAYQPPSIDNIEDVENYRKGGFHPVQLGDAFSHGRYRVLHKLGFGGSSTVWLARDELSQRLVSLKILTAERSNACPEPEILRYLQNNPSHTLGREYILPLHDCFHTEGPNGRHTCLVSLFAGPSLSQLSESPGQPGGCRRLRGHAARQIAKQVGLAIEFLHSQGVVHGDLTASNILFQLADIKWSDQDITKQFGPPVTESLRPLSAEQSVCAPEFLVAPLQISDLDTRHFTGNIQLIDFGESFLSNSPPATGLRTPFSYLAPEGIFDAKASVWADLWALGCIIYEIRAGTQLFASFFGGPDEVLRQIVQTFGKLPEPWWSAWTARQTYFNNNDGKPRDSWLNGIPLAVEYPLGQQVRDIGAEDGQVDLDSYSTHSWLEPLGTRLTEAEASELEDLLFKLLQFSPEKRLSAGQVVKHPWLQGVE